MVCFTSASPAVHTSSDGLHIGSDVLAGSARYLSLQEPWSDFQWVDRAAYSSIFTCPRSFYSCTYYRDYRDTPFFYCIIRATYFSDTCTVYGRSSPWSNPDRFSIASSYIGSDISELRVKWWWHIVLARSSYLSIADRPLGFGVWRQRGRGIKYVSHRGSDTFRGSLSITFGFYVWYIIMHSCVFTFMHQTIFMWVISMWSWYLTCVLSTLNLLYVISLVLCSFALLPCFTPMQMSFTTCTHAYSIPFEYIMLAWVI